MAGKAHTTTDAEKALHDQTNILPRSQLLVVFATLSVTLLIAMIDQNGISVTLPTIAADLDAGNTISWAGTSSLLANTTFQMLYGRLSDIFGRKAIFLSTVGFLAVADLLCGFSQNPTMLYVFRGIAGIGGGGINNLALIIVSDIVSLEERGKYQGINGAMIGLGNLLGPFLAAAFVENATWRAFFWMLSPLGVLAGILSWFYIPNKPPVGSFRENASRIDYAGSVASSLGAILLLIPISGGGAYFAWDSPLVISFLTIGGVSMLAFLLIEWKFAKLPMMPMSMFRSLPVSVLLVQSFIFGAVYQSYLYYLPLYLQNAHQFPVLTSAGVYSSLVAFQSMFSVLSGQYISRRKRYGEVLWFGFIIWTLGVGLTLLYTRYTPRGIIIIPLMLIGTGVGCVLQPSLVALQAHSPKSRRAVVISNRNFFRSAGGAVGLAVSAAVLQASLRANLPPAFSHLSDNTYMLSIQGLARDDVESILDAYMSASRAVFIMQVPLIGVCLLGCFLVRDKGLQPIEESDQGLSQEGALHPNPHTESTQPEEGQARNDKT